MNEPLHIVCPHCTSINNVPGDRISDDPKCGKCRKHVFISYPLKMTGLNFFRHLNNTDIPLLVDFWASWCGPCKMMAPVFEQAAEQLQPGVRVAKLNTEKEAGIAAQFYIRSIPTMIIFNRGREIARQSGAVDLGSLITWVQSHI